MCAGGLSTDLGLHRLGWDCPFVWTALVNVSLGSYSPFAFGILSYPPLVVSEQDLSRRPSTYRARDTSVQSHRQVSVSSVKPFAVSLAVGTSFACLLEVVSSNLSAFLGH
jgi:hypothetical protein